MKPGPRDRHTLRLPLRTAALRTRLIVLVALPGAVLTCLWGSAAGVLLDQALSQRSEVRAAEQLGSPLYQLVGRVQGERQLTAEWEARGRAPELAALRQGRSRTDDAVRALHAAAGHGPAGVDPSDLDGLLAQLGRQRSEIDRHRVTASMAGDYYTDAVTESLSLADGLSRVGDPQYDRAAAGAVAVLRTGERAARAESALSGGQSGAAHAELGELAELTGAAGAPPASSPLVQGLPGDVASAYERLLSGADWTTLAAVGQTAESGSALTPERVAQARDAADRLHTALSALADRGRTAADDAAESRTGTQLLAVAAGSLLALAALLLGALLTRNLIRRTTDRLSDLRRVSRELAETRLPELIERLGRGEDVDVQAEVSGREFGDDELGRTATRVTAHQLAAMAATVQRARNTEGTRQVFLNLARRTQVLIHRQITGLDELEREHDDPKLLHRLFEMDHLATRIRRNAENLAILGGALPARQWRHGVPLVKVVRSAVSEIEHYTRVKVNPVPRALLTGPAVTDVIHLLAELIENGATFSPPHTQVVVSCQQVPRGFVVEVEDRGLGMDEEDLERFNAMLAEPPEPNAVLEGQEPRLGLYVVARLAHRHGVQVSLRPSPYGGTCAIVLLPGALLEESADRAQPGLFGLPSMARIASGGALPAGEGADSEDSSAEGAQEDRPEDQLASGAAALGAMLAKMESEARSSAPKDPAPEPAPVLADDRTDDHHPKAAEEAVTPDRPARQAVTPLVLPKRVRQERLARQMRSAADADASDDVLDEFGEADRPTAERSRNTMAAIQRGTRKARTDAPERPSVTQDVTKDQ